MAITFIENEEKHIDFSLEPKLPPEVFDPWQYDVNNSCYIETDELTQAISDFEAGLITEEQQLQVIALWSENIQNPACEPEPDLDMKLKSGDIGANWWSYSSSERQDMAKYAIEKYSVGVGASAWAQGQFDCAGGPYDIETEKILCYQHAFLRFLVFGDSDLPTSPMDLPISVGYWRDAEGNWHCLYNPNSFKLPVYWVSLVSWWFIKPEGPYLTHSMCALQVGPDKSNFDSWIFFQYSDTDIRPGVKPHTTANTMKVGDLVQVKNVTHLSNRTAKLGDDK